jgi:hypothetical protein
LSEISFSFSLRFHAWLSRFVALLTLTYWLTWLAHRQGDAASGMVSNSFLRYANMTAHFYGVLDGACGYRFLIR